jgi:hypothetical protein
MADHVTDAALEHVGHRLKTAMRIFRKQPGARNQSSACHGTIGVPIGDAGSSRPNGPVGSDSGTTACDALPVDTIGCASGEPIYTCVVDSGAPHWSIGCP